jgi:peptidoglycan lytic transglycosylase G
MSPDEFSPNATRNRYLIVAAIAVAGALVLFLVANVVAGVVSGGSAAVAPGQPATVSITPGSSATTIYRTLSDAGVVSYGDIESAARQANAESRLQPGTYAFVTGMNPSEVLRLLLEGGTTDDSRTITVVEGWTVDRIAEQLADLTEFEKGDFINALETGAVSSPLLPEPAPRVSASQRWEGLLYPAKYQIPEGTQPAGMLQIMADEMVRRFESIDWAPISDMDLTRYEALVLGSLIERESGTETDRPLISSVLHNRLSIDMRLQIDATVIYALGENPGRVLAEHLDVDSPYNTYRIDGLPPTPIGTVSEASLRAAIAPAESDYLFYVLASPDGSHAFAVTYDQHQKNVQAAKEAGVLP